jgi:hypothetical protein
MTTESLMTSTMTRGLSMSRFGTDPAPFQHATDGDIRTHAGFFRTNGFDVTFYPHTNFSMPIVVGSITDEWWENLGKGYTEDDLSASWSEDDLSASWSDGHSDGYSDGWREAIDAVTRAVESL